MLIYGPIIVQKQSYGPATLTITGNVISSKTKELVVTWLKSIVGGMQYKKVVPVDFLLLTGVHES